MTFDAHEIHFRRAVRNISRHGDTDVFPWPIECRCMFDEEDAVVDLMMKLHRNFGDMLASWSPQCERMQAMAGYTGFRWVTQVDPLWHAYCPASTTLPH